MDDPLSPYTVNTVRAMSSALQQNNVDGLLPALLALVECVFNDGLRHGRAELQRDQLAGAIELQELRKQYPGLPPTEEEKRNGS